MQQDFWIYLGVFAAAVFTGMAIALWRMNAVYRQPRSGRRANARRREVRSAASSVQAPSSGS